MDTVNLRPAGFPRTPLDDEPLEADALAADADGASEGAAEVAEAAAAALALLELLAGTASACGGIVSVSLARGL
jgi:hypothetical protein